MTSHYKRRYSYLLLIMIFPLVMSYSSVVHAAATKLIWDQSDFRCGDICGEMERGYRIYTKIAGEDYTLKKEITDPSITECNLSELSLVSGNLNYIVIEAYKKFDDNVAVSMASDEIIWDDISPQMPTNLASTPGLETPVTDQITIQWDATPDNADGSGLAGYYIKVDTNPETVPSTADRKIGPEITSMTITLAWPELTTAGNYYVHISAVDNALNLGPANHYGPFTVVLGPAVTISYSKPDRPYQEGKPFTESDGTIIVTATFSEVLSGPPQIAIDYADNDADISPTPMTATEDNKVWTYPMVIPSGNNGPAKITITGSNINGKPVASHTGNEFSVDNEPPEKVKDVKTSNAGSRLFKGCYIVALCAISFFFQKLKSC